MNRPVQKIQVKFALRIWEPTRSRDEIMITPMSGNSISCRGGTLPHPGEAQWRVSIDCSVNES